MILFFKSILSDNLKNVIYGSVTDINCINLMVYKILLQYRGNEYK